jgi:hypothetical protein
LFGFAAECCVEYHFEDFSYSFLKRILKMKMKMMAQLVIFGSFPEFRPKLVLEQM